MCRIPHCTNPRLFPYLSKFSIRFSFPFFHFKHHKTPNPFVFHDFSIWSLTFKYWTGLIFCFYKRKLKQIKPLLNDLNLGLYYPSNGAKYVIFGSMITVKLWVTIHHWTLGISILRGWRKERSLKEEQVPKLTAQHFVDELYDITNWKCCCLVMTRVSISSRQFSGHQLRNYFVLKQ